MQSVEKTVFDDAITVIAISERPREDFWLSYKLIKNGVKNYGFHTQAVKTELFSIRNLVLSGNDVGTATVRLAKLADRLSKILRRGS